MPYRKRPQVNRRYSHTDTDTNANINLEKPHNDIEKIPLPNEVDELSNSSTGMANLHRKSIFDLFMKRIHIDDIIIVGLIFLLLDEGIDDDILLLLLVYILLF